MNEFIEAAGFFAAGVLITCVFAWFTMLGVLIYMRFKRMFDILH